MRGEKWPGIDQPQAGKVCASGTDQLGDGGGHGRGAVLELRQLDGQVPRLHRQVLAHGELRQLLRVEAFRRRDVVDLRAGRHCSEDIF